MKFLSRWTLPVVWTVTAIALLIVLVLPLPAQPRWQVVALVLALVVLLSVAWVWRSGRERAAQVSTRGALETVGADLPVVFVIGPYASALFPRNAEPLAMRREAGAVWLYVPTPAALDQAMTRIKQAHGHLAHAALLPVIPDGNTDAAMMRREFTAWRRTLTETCQYPASVLPCFVATYAHLGADPKRDGTSSAVWFGDTIDFSASLPSVDNLRQRIRAVREGLEQYVSDAAYEASVQRNALGQALLTWLDESALSSTLAPLGNTAPFALQGFLLADIPTGPARPSAWTYWLTEKTGLQVRFTESASGPLPVPSVTPLQARLASMPLPEASVRRKSTRWAIAAPVALLALCFIASGWNNADLVHRISTSLAVYNQVPNSNPDGKRDALHQLESDRTELRNYERAGVPLGLGWGLYPGAALGAALDRAIASYRPPPVALTLDSLSLFDSGKTTLRPGVAKQLAGPLREILASSGTRVLIAGHTDNVGSAAANLQLSEVRARAIRDWFVSQSGLPPTRFAIQGYGDTRPVASNESADGRARNRRVVITLIPDEPSH